MRRKVSFLGPALSIKMHHHIALTVLVCATLLSSHPALAQFSQQGPKLVGTGATGSALQGTSASLSADGNTAIIGGPNDNSGAGAAWVWTRSGGVWSQQGNKLVGSGAVGGISGLAQQGWSVSLSADGNTAIVGGPFDNGNAGAAWVWTRSGGAWTQQGAKLIGTDAVGKAFQGYSVSLSADGNTAIIGGPLDIGFAGAAWVWTRSGGVWTQQGPKLVGSGAVGPVGSEQGTSVSLSADGNTAIVGGAIDNLNAGAAWVWTRSGGAWTQQGPKLVGSGAVGGADQGTSVSLSADGNTAIVGGYGDNSGAGAAWVWTRSGGVWTQQGTKLVGSDAVGSAQGVSVSLSADGNTAIVGGLSDNNLAGAAWVWTRSGGVWSQQGNKLVGSDAVGNAAQGRSVSLSADGNTAIVGGYLDNSNAGAAWVFAAASPKTCTRVIFVGVRGSGEPYTINNLGMGETVKAAYTAVAAGISGLESFGVPYDATAAVPITNFADAWFASETIGEFLLRGYLKQQITACPGVSFLLAGYSQGAMVVGNVVQSLDPATADHVLGVGLMGDPEFNPTSTVDRGTFNKKLSGALGTRPEFDTVFQKRTVSYCISGDPVCNIADWNLIRCLHSCPHYNYASYPSEKSSYAEKVGTWLAQQYAANKPPAP